MTRVAAVLNNTQLFIASLCFLALISVAFFWPASWWLRVDLVQAGPAKVAQQVPMIVERTISRPFFAEWTATVRRFTPGGWSWHCGGQGQSVYREGSELPDELTLEWWTGGGCKTLPEGRYVVETSWIIEPTVGFLPPKRVYATSNIFEVTP